MFNKVSLRSHGKKKKKLISDRTDTMPLEEDENSCDDGGTAEQNSRQENDNAESGKARKYNDHPLIEDVLSDVRKKYDIASGQIGRGLSAVVRKCIDRQTGEWYAIKSIVKSEVDIEDIKEEVGIMREVSHPNIIKLVDVFEDVKYLHLIMELCSGGELFDQIIEKKNSDEGHFSEQDTVIIVRGILEAIKYCHDEKHIVHRDLKPENFLFKTKTNIADIKIIDFGLSCHDTQNNGIMKTRVGTPYYIAPEVLNGEYTNSCDIWSIGVITYILLCGYPPFKGKNDNQILNSVRMGQFDFLSPSWNSISDTAKDFIRTMLRRDPRSRPSAAAALHHEWMKEEERVNRKDMTEEIFGCTEDEEKNIKKMQNEGTEDRIKREGMLSLISCTNHKMADSVSLRRYSKCLEIQADELHIEIMLSLPTVGSLPSTPKRKSTHALAA